MQYRGKENSIVQRIKPGTWKWTVRLDENNVRTGVDKTRSATWEDAYHKLIGAVALEKVKVIGRRESIPEVIPGAYFTACPIVTFWNGYSERLATSGEMYLRGGFCANPLQWIDNSDELVLGTKTVWKQI